MRNLKQQFNVIDGEVTVLVSFIEALAAVREILDSNFEDEDEIVYATGCDYERAREIQDHLNYLRWVLIDVK